MCAELLSDEKRGRSQPVVSSVSMTVLTSSQEGANCHLRFERSTRSAVCASTSLPGKPDQARERRRPHSTDCPTAFQENSVGHGH